jgi:N-acetylmuramoyl-L-alanine amidase
MKKSWLFGIVFTLCLFVTACSLCVGALRSPVPVFAVKDGVSIVLDAGHGGVDGGVSGKNTGVKESDLNLSITLKLKEVLEDAGFDVTLTRKTEAGLYGAATKGFKKRDMQKRKEIIEKTSPAFVVSVHQNFYPSGTTRGGQVFYLKGDEKGKAFATAIQDSVNALYQTQNARKRVEMAAEYFLLKCAPCPSVIVECGFLSNAEDERLLCDGAWQKKMASAIFSGLLAYLKTLETAL